MTNTAPAPLSAPVVLSLIAQGWIIIESDGSIVTIQAPEGWPDDPKELLIDTTIYARAQQSAPSQAQAGAREIRFVCSGPPGPDGTSFIEVEDQNGRSFDAGEWRVRKDGLWELVVCAPSSTPPHSQAGEQKLAAIQVTIGQGYVDIGQFEFGERRGVLLRPRDTHIPYGQPGELQNAEYWTVPGDVVIWVDGSPDVLINELAALNRTPAPQVPFNPYDITGAVMSDPECYKELDGRMQERLCSDIAKNIGWVAGPPLTAPQERELRLLAALANITIGWENTPSDDDAEGWCGVADRKRSQAQTALWEAGYGIDWNKVGADEKDPAALLLPRSPAPQEQAQEGEQEALVVANKRNPDARQLDRVMIGKGEYVRADEAVRTIAQLRAELESSKRVYGSADHDRKEAQELLSKAEADLERLALECISRVKASEHRQVLERAEAAEAAGLRRSGPTTSARENVHQAEPRTPGGKSGKVHVDE